MSKTYSDDKLAEFKSIVADNLSLVKEELSSLEKDMEARKDQIAEANLDFNENSKHFQQQAKNDRQIRRLQQRQSDLEAAIERIEDGTYGVDERTGELIREERLKAMPTATFDIQQA